MKLESKIISAVQQAIVEGLDELQIGNMKFIIDATEDEDARHESYHVESVQVYQIVDGDNELIGEFDAYEIGIIQRNLSPVELS